MLRVWQKCGKQSYWRAATEEAKKDVEIIYTNQHKRTQTVHTCGVSVWVLRANVIHLAVSMRIEILYLYDFSFLFCSLHAMYMVVLSIRERSYVLWSLFIKRLHTNGNSQPKPYTVLWLWHAFSFSFSLCVYTCARIVMNKRLDDISSVFSYHLFHILLRLEWLQIFVQKIWNLTLICSFNLNELMLILNIPFEPIRVVGRWELLPSRICGNFPSAIHVMVHSSYATYDMHTNNKGWIVV